MTTTKKLLIKIAKILNSKYFVFGGQFLSIDPLLFVHRQNEINKLMKIIYHEWGGASFNQMINSIVFLAKDESNQLKELDMLAPSKVWMKRAKNLEDFINNDLNKGVYD
jgi:hypothetical protein